MKKENTPLVSVVMSVYNEPEDWMSATIDSILNQTFTDFEFIIVNDYPERPDNSRILNKYKKNDSRVVILENIHNSGLIKSLNKGFSESRGKYIARMDADDIAKPQRIEKQVSYMETHPECIVCGTEIMPFKNGHNLWFLKKRYKYDDVSIKRMLLQTSCFAHPTVMIRRDILVKTGIRYNEDYKHAEDYKFWIDLSKYGVYHNIDERLLFYRISPTQVTSSKSNKKIIADILGKCKDEYLHNYLGDRPEILCLMNNNKYTYDTVSELKRQGLPKDVLYYLMYNLYTSTKFEYSKKNLFWFVFSLDCMKFDILSTRYILRRFNAL